LLFILSKIRRFLCLKIALAHLLIIFITCDAADIVRTSSDFETCSQCISTNKRFN